MPLGLYVSIPFCRTKCSYCNFASDVFSKAAYENYVARLEEDIADSRHLASELGCGLGSADDETVDSIYLGGGTPSILDDAQLRRIFAAVRAQFPVTPDAEITVECAPGTLTPALVETLLKCGVNRVSLGVQSFVDREARSVGRLHNRSTVLEEIARLREAGLANINVDLIAGLPHQTAESWAFSVAETIATGVPHVSVYMLEVDDDSRLGRELIAGGTRYHAHYVPDDDAIADFYQQSCEQLAAHGIEQYEISNFARSTATLAKNQSRHNLKYWTRRPYIGFGVDAHSMLPKPINPILDPAVRFATPDSLDAYMNRLPHKGMPVSAQAAIEETVFLGLRLNCGIDLNHFHSRGDYWERYGCWKGQDGERHDLSRATDNAKMMAIAPGAISASPEFTFEATARWETAIHECLNDGLLEQQGTILRLTARGRLLSNEVFARFLSDKIEETTWEPVT